MTTQEQRAEWRALAERLSYFGLEGKAQDAITALLADVDALTQERDSMRLSHQLLAAKFDEACAERDALAAVWAQVVAISDEMNPKQGGPFGGDTNIAAYNMSRVRDVVREWKDAQNAVLE